MTARSVGGPGPPVGVLALQGDVAEHLRMLTSAGARAVRVRRPEELSGVAGLVLPGGESTTIAKLARTFELLEPLRAAVQAQVPIYGSCAGMILLADRVLDGTADQETVGGLDITVRRNAFGRQVDSFEADLALDEALAGSGGVFRAVFIRAPWVEDVGPGVGVLARVRPAPEPGALGRIVAVRRGNLLATSFHPELTGDDRVHRYFVDLVRQN